METNDIEALRAMNQVRLIEEKDEGSAVASLPNGVYGFSYSPQQETPLFRDEKYQCFEVHKLADGNAHLIGFVTEQDAGRLSANEEAEVNLYPDLWNEAVKLVSIPFSRMKQIKGPTRHDGNSVSLRLDPATDSVS